ncbi:hypothetical protein [Ruania zhangjianzhongii]|uniref:hypothetical protein n=1 Tax=Ruania zhangjianzhongii TaxID=2603206 RepID=UPI0011CCD98A|nr:hypothetical protein [Ruania zhangjianzhongii]
MSVPAKRHHLPRPARIAGTVAAAVAASMIVVPGAHAAPAPAPGQALAAPAITRDLTESPAVAEAVVSLQATEMVYGSTGELVAAVGTVDGDPVTSGTVSFLLNGRTLSADVVDGSASVPVTTADFGSVHGYPLNTGGYWFRATYTGEGHTDAEASAKLQVSPADPALEATIAPEAVPGEAVAIEGRLTAQPDHEGQPQGSLQLVVDGEPVGDPVRVGDDGGFVTEFTAPESWQPGEHTVELTLPRHGNFNAASFALTTTVNPATSETVVRVQDAEMVYGSTGELVAAVETVDGDPVTSGTVSFLLNGRTVSADVVDGSADM